MRKEEKVGFRGNVVVVLTGGDQRLIVKGYVCEGEESRGVRVRRGVVGRAKEEKVRSEGNASGSTNRGR